MYLPKTCSYCIFGVTCFVKGSTTLIFLKDVANVVVDLLRNHDHK